MKLDNVLIEPSRELDLVKILGELPAEIHGTNDLILKAEAGYKGERIYLRPIKGRIHMVITGEEVEKIAGDDTFYCGRYKGQKFDVNFSGYTDHSPLNTTLPSIRQNL